MARSKGFQGIVGLKKASTWGTAVACGSGDGLRVLSIVPDVRDELIMNDTLGGNAHQLEPDTGARFVTATLRMPLFYQGLQRLFAAIQGTAGTPSTVDTSGKAHTHQVADLDGVFWSLAWEVLKDTTVQELTTAKLLRLTIRCQASGRAEVEATFAAHNCTGDSATNTTTTIDTVTLPSNLYPALFRHMVFRMNDQGDGAIDADDRVWLTGFEITIDRTFAADEVTTEFGNRISEPQADGHGKVTGTLTFANLHNAAPGGNLQAWIDKLAGTTKKADVVWTGDVLAGAASSYFSIGLYLPEIRLGDGSPGLSGPGRLGWSLPFEAFRVTSAPTGFTAGYVDPVTIYNVNQDANNPLA